MMKNSIVTLFVFLLSAHIMLQAKEYKIHSAKELGVLQLKPGDKVIMQSADWKDQQLKFKGTGTKNQPITLTSATPGVITLSGSSTLKIEGTWLIADGLSFANGYIQKGEVVQFAEKSTWCRLTNTAIVDYNNPDKTSDYRWVSVNGFNNRVDHCLLKGKNHQGVTLVVWLTDKPNYHKIDHNYFGERPELGGNGGETIRIGTSTWSFHDSYTMVEHNIFDRCNGEIEAVSVKSCKNTIRNNLFYECKATLTLRHGNGSEVYGNYFIGNNKPGTGGIRIIGEDHNVHDNYLQGLNGKQLSAAISVMAGLPMPILTSHWQVKNASITNNIIVACQEPFAIGAGYNGERHLPALNTTFSDNTIWGDTNPVKWYDTNVVVTFKNNTLINDTGSPPTGFLTKQTDAIIGDDGLYSRPGQARQQLFWKTELIGPAWIKELKKAFIAI